jgi:hypothetical protein
MFSRKLPDQIGFNGIALIRRGVNCGIGVSLVLLLGACSGRPLVTPHPVAAFVPGATTDIPPVVVEISNPLPPIVSAPPVASQTPVQSPVVNCTDTIRATVAIHTFLNNYNTGNMSAILNQFSSAISAYADGSESFTGTTLTDIQQHLNMMFAKHDHLTAPDAALTVKVETGQSLTDYYVTLNQVTRRNDSLTKDATGSIVLGLDCVTLQVNAIALRTR